MPQINAPHTRPAPTIATDVLGTGVDASRPGTPEVADPRDSFSRDSVRLRPSAIAIRSTLKLASGGVSLRAPDGMIIEGSALTETSDIPNTRADRIRSGMKAEVPQRVQQGPTCGLYALGMVMDYWHQKDALNPSVLVSDKDIGGKGRNYNDEPTHDERMLSYVQKTGYTSAGEMFKAREPQ